jgi:hypothetical protein
MSCKGLACFFNSFAAVSLLCATALLSEAPKAECGFGYPNNLFFHPIAA